VEIRGFLEVNYEVGSEGEIWSLRDPGLPDDESLYPLEGGDVLRVLDAQGGVLW